MAGSLVIWGANRRFWIIFAGYMNNFSELFEILPIGMVLANSAGTIVEVNRRMEEIFLVDRSVLVGSQLASFLSLNIRPENFGTEVALRQFITNQNFDSKRLRIASLDGSAVSVECSSYSLLLSGERYSLLTFTPDCDLGYTEPGADDLAEQSSPKAQPEKTVGAHEQALLSRQEIMEVANSNLKIAVLQAEKEKQLMAHSLAIVSHEMRTPLSGILGMATVLLRSELDPSQREAVQALLDTGKFLKKIIEDTLDVGLLESKRISVQPILFDAVTLVASTCKLLSDQAQSKGIAIRSFVEPRIPRMLFGDRDKIQQILINLLHNAIKFSEGRDVSVSVELSSSINDCLQLEFAVSDQGIGIADTEIERIFLPFRQANGEVGKSFGGSGLGLAICSSLASLMNGNITVESAVGRGSCFTLSVPLVVKHEIGGSIDRAGHSAISSPAKCTSTRLPVKNESQSVVSASKFRVAVFGVCRLTRRVLDNVLSSIGMQAEFLDWTTWKHNIAAPYDLALIDLENSDLPAISQEEKVDSVRRELEPSTPLILLLDSSQVLDEKRLRFGGQAVWTLSKPINLPQLLNLLQNIALSGGGSGTSRFSQAS